MTIIVGAGRMGRGLGQLLVDRGASVRFAVRAPRSGLPAPFGLRTDAATYRGGRWIILATPDDAIRPTAADIGALGVIARTSVIFHLSGARGTADVLKPLRLTGAALGSFHPLQSLAVPATAVERLPGSFVGIEGDPRAVRAARRLARFLDMTPVAIPERGRAAYHAAATFVSGYVTALYGTAVEIAVEAGVEARDARRMFRPLLEGTVANLGLLPPARAMTGAVPRGDLATVEAHLAALHGEHREVYAAMGRAAAALARTLPDASPRLDAIVRTLSGKPRGRR